MHMLTHMKNLLNYFQCRAEKFPGLQKPFFGYRRWSHLTNFTCIPAEILTKTSSLFSLFWMPFRPQLAVSWWQETWLAQDSEPSWDHSQQTLQDQGHYWMVYISFLLGDEDGKEYRRSCSTWNTTKVKLPDVSYPYYLMQLLSTVFPFKQGPISNSSTNFKYTHSLFIYATKQWYMEVFARTQLTFMLTNSGKESVNTKFSKKSYFDQKM